MRRFVRRWLAPGDWKSLMRSATGGARGASAPPAAEMEAKSQEGGREMTSKTVVILGGGVGGLVAANELRRRLPQQHRVILVEKDPRHAFAPSFLWLMVGDRRPDQITRDIRALVSRGVEVTQAQVVGIEPGGGRVETSGGPIHFDYLVIALGAEYAPEMMAGLTEA